MARIGEDKYRPYMRDTGMQTGAGRIAGQPSTGTAQDNTNQRVTQPVQRLGTEYWRKDADNAQNQQNGAGDAAGAGAGGGGGGGYTQDPYAAQANALYQQLLQRGPFQYDLQGDMLYRQYADQYSQMGQTAMRDAMGTAAGLTGGYGNSWAGTVGNQAYQQYLGQLNAMIPDFYDRAYQRWLDEGDNMLNQYQLALSRVPTGGGGGTDNEEGTAGTLEDLFATGDQTLRNNGQATMTFEQYLSQMDPTYIQGALAPDPNINTELASLWYDRLRTGR